VLITYTTCIKEKFPGQLISSDCSNVYIGSGWIYKLGLLLQKRGIDFVAAEVALQKIQSQTINPSKVILIQDGKNAIGQKLAHLGACKFIIVNLESPLYDPYFYNSLSKYIDGFEWVYSYDGFFNKVPINRSKLTPFFPSFSNNERLNLLDLPKNNKVCLIASNKFLSSKFEYSALRNFKQIKHYASSLCNPEFRAAINACLHHSRIQAIQILANHQLIDLYGHGWNDLSNLPSHLKSSLNKIIPEIYKGPTTNKHLTLSQYKFSLCMENISLSGYVTEKIIDSFVAGSIPIYFGAPNIREIIPEDAMINGASLGINSNLIQKILTMSQIEFEKLKLNGINFLSNYGQSYSLDSIANEIFLKIISKQLND
jgi:hypothetical protein